MANPFSLSGLRRLLRSDHEFSPADQQLREAMITMMKPEELAKLDQHQMQLWQNDFDKSLPLTAPTAMRRQGFEGSTSNTPMVDPYRVPGIGMTEPANMRKVPETPWLRPFQTFGTPEYPLSELGYTVNKRR